jgi:hypothetical protein
VVSCVKCKRRKLQLHDDGLSLWMNFLGFSFGYSTIKKVWCTSRLFWFLVGSDVKMGGQVVSAIRIALKLTIRAKNKIIILRFLLQHL